jgi:hypothetical protein
MSTSLPKAGLSRPAEDQSAQRRLTDPKHLEPKLLHVGESSSHIEY